LLHQILSVRPAPAYALIVIAFVAFLGGILPQDRFHGVSSGQPGDQSKRCVYQVIHKNIPLGLWRFNDEVSLGDLLTVVGISNLPVATSDRERSIPCSSRVIIGDPPDLDFQPMGGADLILAGQRIDLNNAAASDLSAVPGIGPRLAERIVEYRAMGHRFSSVDDLRNVSGFGAKKEASVEPFLTTGHQSGSKAAKPRHQLRPSLTDPLSGVIPGQPNPKYEGLGFSPTSEPGNEPDFCLP
jgi:competence ComEA-like helix-hairpin-helix protein